jgi:alpha-1,2-mannosyltransferase
MHQPTNAAVTASSPRDTVLVLAIPCALAGLYNWLVFAMAFHHDGLIGPRYNAPGTDYMVYWSAVRAALAGNFSLLGDPAALTEQINQTFQNWLSSPLPLHPWLYPPHFLLFLLPFAALPFAWSFALFQVATFAAAVVAGWCWGGPERWRGLWLIGMALAPAAAVNAVCGQNAFLTLALLLGGVGLLGRADIAAGAILGLLTYKPQFALLLPVALVALRNWRALAAAAGSAALAVAASAALFGIAPWQDWLGRTLAGGAPGDAVWVEWGRLWGLSIWTCARLLGAPGWLANMAQGLAALLAAGCVWMAFRRPLAPERRMATLLVATLLAAPHCSPYDLMLLAAAVLLLVRELLDGEALPVSAMLLLLPWAAPLAAVPRAIPAGFAVPLLMLGMLALLFPWRVIRQEGWRLL